MQYICILIGGFLGSILRYLVGEWVSLENGFPIGTLTVNLIGCFVLSWFLSFTLHKINLSSVIKTGISTGLLGSFTTFSTFSVETLQLFQHGEMFLALLYILGSIVFGFAFAWIGYVLGIRMSKNYDGDIQ